MEQKDHLLSFQIIAKIKIRANPWSDSTPMRSKNQLNRDYQ